MARIRTIKPEFWTHEELSALPEATHMLAAALLNYADDEGYFNAHPGLIKAACCPLRETSVSVHDSLNQLSNVGYLRIGTGRDGKRYGHIVTFDDHQRVNRPTPSKIKALGVVWEASSMPHAQLSESSPLEGKGREQEEEGKGTSPPIPPASAGGTDRRRKKGEGITFAAFVQACRASGDKPLPRDHAVFDFASDAGIPVEFLELAWREFARQYRATKKTQAGVAGWRQKFENCVRRNWYKLWWFPQVGSCELTTAGVQLKREREAEEAEKPKQGESGEKEKAA